MWAIQREREGQTPVHLGERTRQARKPPERRKGAAEGLALWKTRHKAFREETAREQSALKFNQG